MHCGDQGAEYVRNGPLVVVSSSLHFARDIYYLQDDNSELVRIVPLVAVSFLQHLARDIYYPQDDSCQGVEPLSVDFGEERRDGQERLQRFPDMKSGVCKQRTPLKEMSYIGQVNKNFHRYLSIHHIFQPYRVRFLKKAFFFGHP